MASSIVLRRAGPSSSFVTKLLHTVRLTATAPAAVKSFNTNAQLRDFDEDERNMDMDRRYNVPGRGGSSPNLFSDVFDPFRPRRSLSQVLNMVDQLVENPFVSNASRGIGAGLRQGWDAKEDADGLYLRVDMPGLGKENVKVSVEENTLTIKGEGENESEEESTRRYSSRIDLPPKLYKLDQIKAEMKNGVLKVMVPKVKEEDKKEVFQINVE